MKKLWTEIGDILKAPFVGNLDLMHLFMLVGVVLIFSAIWGLILNHVRLAAMEAV
jgi:hypothetical protein